MRRSRREQRDAGLTCNARLAAVVGQTGWRRNRWRGRRSYRRVRECEQKCSTSGRLGSIPQACARARLRATCEQIKGQWCESSTGTVCRRCDRVRRSCRGYAGVPTVFLQHTHVSSRGLAVSRKTLRFAEELA
jgi:hypothetical protein